MFTWPFIPSGRFKQQPSLYSHDGVGLGKYGSRVLAFHLALLLLTLSTILLVGEVQASASVVLQLLSSQLCYKHTAAQRDLVPILELSEAL